VGRRIGLEQEFFLVDEAGEPSDRADEFLARCWEAAAAEGHAPENFVGECSRGMVEVNTPPAGTLDELSRAYLAVVDFALRVGRGMGIRLYPLAAYPLPMTPPLRADPSYELQALTLGRERFLHAGRCVGTHLHLEVPEGTVDRSAVISSGVPAVAREELLNLYNLGVALDPAIIVLTRSTPFYEGRAPGLAVRTVRYRGSAAYGWEGLYTGLPLVGGLKPYAESAEELIEQQLAGYDAWLRAIARAGFEEHHYAGTGGDILKAHWGPVRISGFGTVELRGIDGNYPEVILAVAALIQAAAHRIRSEALTVEPSAETRTFEVAGDTLLVPDFEYVSRSLYYAAVTAGVEDPAIAAYLDSITEFAAPGAQGSEHLERLRFAGGSYRTTEAEILRDFPPSDAPLSREEGLRLVRASCDRLEEQVSSMRDLPSKLDAGTGKARLRGQAFAGS
jgi:gamma-glutamyl:cysteine ligase YbdK (ATP-grasp superfamily)